MKKKTAAMVLAALMAFSMTACGNGSTQKEDDSTAADQETTETTETADNTVAEDTTSGDETVELHWLNKCESDVEAQIWQQVADLVHEKYPNITVNVENTDWTSYWTKLPVELASGNAPDLIYMHFSRASDYTNSMLSISDYIEKDEDINIDDFYSGILDSFIFDDQIYALPYDFGPYIMYYNKDLFDKYGVEYPDENTTWEEFKDKCKQLTQDGNYGTVFASSLDYYDPQVLSLGGEIINEKGEFSAYTMPYIHDYSKETGALNITPGDFYYGDLLDAITDLEQDFEELNKAGVVAREINRGSFLYDLDFLKMCDTDKYQTNVKKPHGQNRNMLNYIIAKIIYYEILAEGADKDKLKALNKWIKKACQSGRFTSNLKKTLEKEPTKLIKDGVNTLSKTL